MSAEISIRRAKFSDLHAIVTLLASDEWGAQREVVTLPLPDSYAKAFAQIDGDPNQLLAISMRGAEILGTFQLTFIPYLLNQGGLVMQIEAVYVAAHARGQGIGEAMMRWAIARARERGCHRVQLTSHKSRLKAHRFYERLGFEASHEGMKLVL